MVRTYGCLDGTRRYANGQPMRVNVQGSANVPREGKVASGPLVGDAEDGRRRRTA
jgi:hypothetical protein